jgi:hypothetical protein
MSNIPLLESPQAHQSSSNSNIISEWSPVRILTGGCTLVAFLLPLKLSLTYIVLIPLLLLWGYTNRFQFASFKPSKTASLITAPLCAFILTALLSGAVGISQTHSFPALASLLFFLLTIPLFASYSKTRSVCLALIAGQTLAAFHSFLDAAIPNTLPRLFLGEVTESGQLAITVPLTLGLIISYIPNSSASKEPSTVKRSIIALASMAIVIATTLVLLGFQSALPLALAIIALAVASSLLCAQIAFKLARRAGPELRQQLALTLIALPLLTCALLVNLKRGPWLGVLLGMSCLIFFYARRFLLPLILTATAIAITIAPIRERLSASYAHFTIEGGRSTIWRIGLELATEYPLGIGYHNSGILREFAPEIPPELKHFHNNLLNIATETGWLGVLTFIWFIVGTIKVCFRNRDNALSVAIGAAIISWQAAGLVEYNFGDSEVTIVVWILLGLLTRHPSPLR